MLSPLLSSLPSFSTTPPPPPPPESEEAEESNATAETEDAPPPPPPPSQRSSLPFGNFFGLLGPPALGRGASAEAQSATTDFTCDPPAASSPDAQPPPPPVDVEAEEEVSPSELSASSVISEGELSVGITNKRPSKGRAKEAWAAGSADAPSPKKKGGAERAAERAAEKAAAKEAKELAKVAAAEEKENGAGQRTVMDKKAMAKAGVAVFDAHRQFITSCVEQLEVHTYMLSQAEAQPVDAAAQLDDYVGGLEALLRERQAALSALQAQLQTFRCTIHAAGTAGH